jgi:hypothetical protein
VTGFEILEERGDAVGLKVRKVEINHVPAKTCGQESQK